MSSSSDLATALEHVLGDPGTEAKFQALRTLHAKKIKSLMGSIDAKEREIDRLKALGKDNRRTEIIQSLKKKLRHHELVVNVLKEELAKKAEMTYEEVNQFVIGKTISGPKRFRPLIREELENHITELERKLELERKMRAKGSSNGNSSGQSTSSSQGPKNKSIKPNARSDSSSPAHGDIDKEGLQHMMSISELQDEILGLKHELDGRDKIISQQKDEICRVREANSTLHGIDEEIDTLDRSYKELATQHQRTVEDLEDTMHRLSVLQEETFQTRAEAEQDIEQQNLEIETLRSQCQQGLKQNNHLLQLMANLESQLEANQPKTQKERSSPARNNNDRSVEVARLSEKLKHANGRIQELEAAASSNDAALNALKDKLRDKNDDIRDLKRTIAELSRHKNITEDVSNTKADGKPSNKSGRESKGSKLSPRA